MKCIEEDIPFEVPEGWEWSRLGTLFSTVTGSTPSTKDTSLYGDEYPFYKPTDLDAGFDVYSSEDTVSEKGYKNGRILPEYSVLVTCIGATIGKTGYIRNSGICNQQINAILPNAFLLPEYTYFCMCSEFEQQQIWTNSSATTLPILNKSKFDNLLFPVPPKEQQALTVERIKELLHFVEIIQTGKSTLQETIKATKTKILDLAIRGKLVPQDPNDEPASVLLERIRAEKEELIKQGKIKREKKESIIFKGDDNSYYEKIENTVECIDTEIPFEIPNSWLWCRLESIGNWQTGSTPSRRNDEYYGGYIPWIKTGDLNNGYIIDIPEYITEKALNETAVKLIPSGTVLIAMYGATIGKVGITTFEATTNQACCACCYPCGVLPEYLFYYLQSQKENFINMAEGGAQPNISKEKIITSLIAVPPYKQQIKILNLINELNKHIDLIEKSLN